MNNSEIKPNSHFWAKVDGKLAVLMRMELFEVGGSEDWISM